MNCYNIYYFKVKAHGESMRTLILFIKGIIVGAGNVVPSFSGATLALVMGIYNEMVQYFGQLLSFFKGNSTGKQVRSFLIPVGLGIVLGTLALAKVIEGLLSQIGRASCRERV
jgi:putative membrane protein